LGPASITLLLLLAFAGFGWLAWRKLAIVAALQPAARFDRPGQRLKSVLINGLLQSRMVRREWRPGVMHAVLFLGFVSLLLRKLQLVAIGYSESASFPDAFGGPFAAFKDAVELAVVAAVLYAFWRRFVRRPARFARRNREAVLVLSLILAIMATDFAFDGFRFAVLGERFPQVAHEREFAFVGSALAQALSGLSPAALQAGYVLAYWMQMVVVLSFLVILPTGEHFHIVTALPTLYFRRGRPANRVPAVDVDKLLAATDEADMRAGVQTARDLTWKDGLDAFTCTECGRCKDACPTHLTGKPLSLKGVNDRLKRHLLEQREAIVGDAAGELPALVGGVIEPETLWACTTCGYCEAACPIELEHLDRFFAMRQHQVMIEGEFPHELKKLFEAYEAQGNPWGLQADARGDWAKGLDVPVVRTAADLAGLDFLFYVGSAMSFDPRGQRIARAFVKILRRGGVRFGILGPREGSTGECVRRVGNEMLFKQLATGLAATLEEVGATRIVTCDPHAMNSLRNEYPELGGRYEVVHHSALIAELLAEGRIAIEPSAERIVYHDPCYLGRHNGEFDAPRAVLARLGTAPPLEFALAREKAMCCGAGGGRMWIDETIGKRINVLRVEQALETSAQTIATACPYCAVMMEDGLAALPGATGTRSRDIAELVADALVAPS
jgi:Fe-S oxidoreductase